MSLKVTFPPFHVIDGSWGSSMLTISDANGLSIVSKESGQCLENWSWNRISHATIKSASNRLVQVKRTNGIKKLVSFTKAQDLDRFERTLKNAVPILTLYNIRRQLKFVIIHYIKGQVTSVKVTKTEQILDVNSNALVSAFIPPPLPPPPQMFSLSQPKLVIGKKTQVKPKNMVDNPALASKDSCLVEMQKAFAQGNFKASQIKSSLGTVPEENVTAGEVIGSSPAEQ